jgi:peptidoglycan/LPS O-acetylase OafA/YrhL
MEISNRELWTVIHGMTFGALFLLAFAGGLAGLYSLRPEWVTVTGIKERMTRLTAGMWAMAVIAWGTVLTGTYIVYPWYRAAPPEGTTDLSTFPRYLLLASENTAEWHKFGMEWKEHVGWIAPIAATVVAYVVGVYGPQLAGDSKMRRALLWFFAVAFVTASVAGMFGAFINKVAPIR